MPNRQKHRYSKPTIQSISSSQRRRLTWQILLSWLRPGIQVKRWLFIISLSLALIGLGLAQLGYAFYTSIHWPHILDDMALSQISPLIRGFVLFALGGVIFLIGFLQLNLSLAAPFNSSRSIREWLNTLQAHQQLSKGLRVVTVGGGTGLPSVLRALKSQTSNINAVVTMADDGGSSGRLRRDYGMQPPGDLRSNITALAQDEALMTRLFDYRFPSGELGGHSFGNLLLAALANLEGNMDKAADAAGRILAIQGRVLPCTLTDVHLVARVRHHETGEILEVAGESKIPSTDWRIEHIDVRPAEASAHIEVLNAIYQAELIVIGPGSLYTSIIPNLMVQGIPEAIRGSRALKIYVCNIATQPGETDEYTVADHVEGIEAHVGPGLVDVVLANNHFPLENAGPNTVYVQAAPPHHPITDRYMVRYTDLTDDERPWRHAPEKLQQIILQLYGERFQLKAQQK